MADFLSRPSGLEQLPESGEDASPEIINSINTITDTEDETDSFPPTPITMKLIALEQKRDFQSITECTTLSELKSNDFIIKSHPVPDVEDLIIYGTLDNVSKIFCPIVPKRLRALVFRAIHNVTHPGIAKSVEIIRARYYWPDMVTDITNWTKTCPPCQINKISRYNRQRLSNFPVTDSRLRQLQLEFLWCRKKVQRKEKWWLKR